MRLNLQSDYALRLLMHLAVNQGALCRIADIADRFKLPKNHLTKIAMSLGREGYVETVRGRSGGLRLAKPAAEITVGAVLRRTEGDFALVECFQSKPEGCLISPACRLKGALGEAMAAFFAVLDQVTLAGLTEENTALAQLLKLEDAA